MPAYRRNRRRRYRRKPRAYRVRTRVKRRYGGVKTRRRSQNRSAYQKRLIYRARPINFLADTAVATLKDCYNTYFELGEAALSPPSNNNYIGQFYPGNYFQSGQMPTFDMYSARFSNFRVIQTTFVASFQNLSDIRVKDVGILLPTGSIPTWTPSAPPMEQPHCRYTTLSVVGGRKDMATLKMKVNPKTAFGSFVDSTQLAVATNNPTAAPGAAFLIYFWQGDGLNTAETTSQTGVRVRVKVYYKCLFYQRIAESS